MNYLRVVVVGMLLPYANISADEFSNYWFSGNAEVSNYTLKQAHYGEVYEGEAALIFVTEPFSKSKQVKLDDVQKAGADKLDVLKMNKTRKFFTGVYPYSLMLSTFTPVDRERLPKLLKAVHSAQEWCGQTYMQVNSKGGSRHAMLESYFEGESSKKTDLGKLLLEDELWSVLRMGPELLPQGKLKLIPSLTQLRFRHVKADAQDATATVTITEAKGRYKIVYPSFSRSLEIEFDAAFPYKIKSWKEVDKGLTTTATLKASKHFPYWNHNRKADSEMRNELKMK